MLDMLPACRDFRSHCRAAARLHYCHLDRSVSYYMENAPIQECFRFRHIGAHDILTRRMSTFHAFTCRASRFRRHAGTPRRRL